MGQATLFLIPLLLAVSDCFISQKKNVVSYKTITFRTVHDDNSSTDKNTTEPEKKLASPLAMAAADWLEEEEDDELMDYWNKFEVSKQDKKATSRPDEKNIEEERNSKAIEDDLTTEERLDRYLTSRGIDRSEKTVETIEKAMNRARDVLSASEVISILECLEDLPYNTIQGGSAWLELAAAYYETENFDKTAEICGKILQQSPHRDIKRQAQNLLKGRYVSKRNYGQRDFWKQVLDPSSWWP